MSSRICSWVVTSSAVVGSSAISSDGLQASAMRDHRTLAHAAGKLVRIVVDPLLGLGNAHLAQQLEVRSRTSRRDRSVCTRSISPICVPMRCSGLSEVIGSWKIMRDLLAPHRAHAGLVEPQQVTTLVEHLADRAGSARRTRLRPMIDRAVTVLPQPDSPTMPSTSPGATAKRQAVDDHAARARRVERDPEAADLEQAAGRSGARRQGSSAGPSDDGDGPGGIIALP